MAGTLTTVDLSQLPAPDVVETLSFETIFAERKAYLISLYPEEDQAEIAAALELESDPRTKLLQENAYREMILRARVNQAALATMLAFATDADLDQIGARYNLQRLVVTAADPDAIPPVEEVMESDDDFRLRIQSSFEGLSVAGPKAAYEFHAKNADGRVKDVSAVSPSPAVVVVTVLARAGDGSAPSDLITIVNTALNDEDVRPVADRLTVQGAEIVSYSISADLYIYPGPESEPIRAASIAKLQTYIENQRLLGRDIRLSAIYAALHVEGVQRAVINSPSADIIISDSQAAYCTGYSVQVVGTDE